MPEDAGMVAEVEALARVAGLMVTPERVAVLAEDFAAALDMIETLHTVETALVPVPFDPAWSVHEGASPR